MREAIESGKVRLSELDEAGWKYFYNRRFEGAKQALTEGSRSPQTDREREFLDQYNQDQQRCIELARGAFGPFANGSAGVVAHRQLLERRSADLFELPSEEVKTYLELQRDQCFAEWETSAIPQQSQASSLLARGVYSAVLDATVHRSDAKTSDDELSEVKPTINQEPSNVVQATAAHKSTTNANDTAQSKVSQSAINEMAPGAGCRTQ